MSHLFDLHGVGVSFGAYAALQDIHLRVARGERLALIGANGCGKSTLLRVMHGLLAPTQGQVRHVQSLRQAMLFQRPHMLRTQAWRHVALGLWLAGRPWREARVRAHDALSKVGLAGVAQQPAHTLSGGQQQRLALARAWVLEPEVLFLDEPTASLDPHAKREVEALIAEFAQGQDEPLTLVWASHNLGQVKRIASRVLYMGGGRLLADLPVHDFFNAEVLARVSPEAHAFVQGEMA